MRVLSLSLPLKISLPFLPKQFSLLFGSFRFLWVPSPLCIPPPACSLRKANISPFCLSTHPRRHPLVKGWKAALCSLFNSGLVGEKKLVLEKCNPLSTFHQNEWSFLDLLLLVSPSMTIIWMCVCVLFVSDDILPAVVITFCRVVDAPFSLLYFLFQFFNVL